MKEVRFWLFLTLTTLTIFWVMVKVRPQKWFMPPVLVIPADNQVVEMRATLQDSGVFIPIEEFVIPPDQVPLILAQLRPAKNHGVIRFHALTEFGEIIIRTRDGNEMRIRFFSWGHNPVVLTVDGKDAFLGVNVGDDGGITLGRTIRDASDRMRMKIE